MANSFVKWCRTKLFNGYKHINVLDQSEGCGRSDTETLVRACEDDILLTPAPTPTPFNTQGTRSNLTAGTYVEEVSCDVSVGAGGDADRQEFAFTLYDFDGHGKVTKDDIAGLVRTIYDAVGSSLSLPPSGSRTIRVKLTVAPEGKRGKYQNQDDLDEPHQESVNVDFTRREEVNVDFTRREEDFIDPCEHTPGHTPGRSHRRRKTRRRSTSLQRHELLQIIQANMEKNNLFYTSFHRRHDHHHRDHHRNRRRRRHGYCDHTGSPPDPAEVKARLLESDCSCRHTHYHSHTHGHNPISSSNCRRHNRSHSHDLSNDSPHVFRCHLLDKTFQPLPPSNTPDQPPSPCVGGRNSSNIPQYHPHQPHPKHYHHHSRSRSYDGGDTTHVSSPRGRSSRTPNKTQQINQSINQSLLQQLQKDSKMSQQMKQDYIGGTELSPHHTKHRHREANHERAMAQVVAWLERGSLLDSSGSPTSPESGVGGGGGSGGGAGSGSACRDQTHHVHQHIHHHYHHYTEKPPPLLI